MTDGIYSSLAGVYDALNGDIDYKKWAGFIVGVIDKYSTVPVKLALDLGCGTGKMTFALRERGYDMTGVDISPLCDIVSCVYGNGETVITALLSCGENSFVNPKYIIEHITANIPDVLSGGDYTVCRTAVYMPDKKTEFR